jgi:hypothetical protein
LSTKGGIMVFQLFHGTSTRLEYYSRIFQIFQQRWQP